VIRDRLRPLYLQERDLVPIVQKARVNSRLVWMGGENVLPPGFDPRTT